MPGQESPLGPGRAGVGRRLSGRRHGRKLRQGLERLITDLLPRVAVSLPSGGARVDPKEIFDRAPERLWLEIGFGSGEHLAWQAKTHPDVQILGAEIYVNGIAALLREIDQAHLTNVRIFEGDGLDLLQALPDASVERVYALFPDPWPKRRHQKRRLIQAPTLDCFARVMRDGAELRIATDHSGYLCWILERACRHGDFAWVAEGPKDWRFRGDDGPATRFETKAIEQGRSPAYLRFRRRPR